MGRGGTRIGAGRPAMRVKAEHCMRIDVREWHRRGLLRPGGSGGWSWRNEGTGETVGSIGYRIEPDSVVLDYSIDGAPSAQRVALPRSPCNFGGSRPWFVCPVRKERVAVLYLRGGRFACRHCQRVAYASQSDDVLGRTWRAQAKLEARLGQHMRRPKGMHRSTCAKLWSGIEACEERRESALGDFLASFLLRHPSLRDDAMFK